MQLFDLIKSTYLGKKQKETLPPMQEMPEAFLEKAKKPTTTAVIVTYNRLELLKETIEAVKNQKTSFLRHIFIVNNHSTDETEKYLETLTDSRITVFNLPENIGGAGGFNFGVRKFMEETDDELVWLMDDDTYPEENALAELQRFYSKEPRVGFLASNVRWKTFDGEPAFMNTMFPRFNMDFGQTYNKWNLPGIYALEIVHSSFVSVAFSRWVVSQIGLPQKEYFIWGDDVEYTNRAADVYPGYMVSGSVVAHKTANNNKPGDIHSEHDEKRIWRFKYEYRNRVLTESRVNPEMGRVKLRQGRFTMIRLRFLSKDPLRKEKIKLIKEGQKLAKSFNPPIEYVGEKPENVRSRKLLLEHYGEEK